MITPPYMQSTESKRYKVKEGKAKEITVKEGKLEEGQVKVAKVKEGKVEELKEEVLLQRSSNKPPRTAFDFYTLLLEIHFYFTITRG